MRVSEILFSLDIPSNEIKTRFKNKQIKLNGEVIENIELDVNDNFIMEAGEFISLFFTAKESNELRLIKNALNLQANELFGDKSNIKLLDSLSGFHCLTIAKNINYILMKN